MQMRLPCPPARAVPRRRRCDSTRRARHGVRRRRPFSLAPMGLLMSGDEKGGPGEAGGARTRHEFFRSGRHEQNQASLVCSRLCHGLKCLMAARSSRSMEEQTTRHEEPEGRPPPR